MTENKIIKQAYNTYHNNAAILNRLTGVKHGSTYKLKQVLLFFLLFFKLLLSKLFIRKKIVNQNPDILIDWEIKETQARIHEFICKFNKNTLETFKYNKKKFNVEQIKLFSHISLPDIFKTTFLLKKKLNGDFAVSSNFFEKFCFTVDYKILEHLTSYANLNVYTFGQIDREATILSFICSNKNLRLNILQHGIVVDFGKEFVKLKVQGFYYLFDFLKTNFLHALEITKPTNMYHFPKTGNLPYIFESKGKKIIAYATSPATSQQDKKNIEQILEYIKNKKYCLIIYPHPLDSKKQYEYLGVPIYAEKRFSNVDLFMSMFSTLGFEYMEINVYTVFLAEKMLSGIANNNQLPLLKTFSMENELDILFSEYERSL